MANVCAIIAGAGTFPRLVAEEAKRQGLTVVGIGMQGWVDPTLTASTDVYEEVAIGQLGRLIERLKVHAVDRAIMAGKVTKEVLFDPRLQFDAEMLAVLGRAKGHSVNDVLGAIADRLGKEGITLLDSSAFLKDYLCPAGVVTRRAPTREEREDIRVGAQAARQLAALDIGQTVVVKRRVVVALEALEGTDAAIQRAHQLAGGDLVVVKRAAPDQDRRFDLPVLGPATLEVALEAGVRCMAVEAHTTILLGKEAMLARANEAKLCLVGLDQAGTW